MTTQPHTLDSADIPDILSQMTEIDRAIRADGAKLGLDRLEQMLNTYRSLQTELATKRERQFMATAAALQSLAGQAYMDDSLDAFTATTARIARFLHDLALHWATEISREYGLSREPIDAVDRLSNIVEED